MDAFIFLFFKFYGSDCHVMFVLPNDFAEVRNGNRVNFLERVRERWYFHHIPPAIFCKQCVSRSLPSVLYCSRKEDHGVLSG